MLAFTGCPACAGHDIRRNGATMTDAAIDLPRDRSLLIVEDDKSFLTRLARAMEGRGFVVTTAESVADGLLQVETAPPAFAVVDMRLGDGNGLDVLSALKRRRPEARAIVLTGYGNIATAVAGNTSSAFMSSAAATSRRPRAASTCIAALCSAFWRSARPGEARRFG